MPALVSVKVANGETIACSRQMLQASWFIQGIEFCADLKVLQLITYDMILGLDWLERFSPMKVHWAQKWMHIPYQGTSVCLQGIVPTLPTDSLVLLTMVSSEDSHSKESSKRLPPGIQQLINQYAQVLTPPVGLPPSRHCAHDIPLLPGSRPMNIRPYRYPPTIKDEIERQVAKMLRQGIIQHSTSEFSSPVLLVKKKDGSYHFCVDYRHLNAMTVKKKYPVPIIDEFLDELVNASWFSTVDLAAGYHLIPLQSGEEHKTTFQTHGGHYEFRVMAFGLSGGPATFQKSYEFFTVPTAKEICVGFL